MCREREIFLRVYAKALAGASVQRSSFAKPRVSFLHMVHSGWIFPGPRCPTLRAHFSFGQVVQPRASLFQKWIDVARATCQSSHMLSYQHSYHAGNLADVHKHALLAWVLAYMTAKDKPISYIETHSGRGLYALDAIEAQKTGEAAAGILRAGSAFGPDHPYGRVLAQVRAHHGDMAYPGSPMIAAQLLRAQDSLTLAELHPQEYDALRQVMGGTGATVQRRDGFELAQAICPPTPRRGVLMIDPSYEVKSDYTDLPDFITSIRRKWNVGVIVLWYPVLNAGLHRQMVAQICADHPDAENYETAFPPVREGHRMTGSGLVVINPPWGMAQEAARIDALIRAL